MAPVSGSVARVLLDVDTGIDDALALLYAAAEPRLDLVGVSAVAGNVPVDIAARNSAAVLAAVGCSSVPVTVGAAVTACGDGPRIGPTNHGVDGLGGVPVQPPASLPAPDVDPHALLKTLCSNQLLTVAACAPLTNVARYASHRGVERIVLVGGELVVEGEPEFNIGHDPVSAAAVLAADVPLTVFPIDVFETISVPSTTVARLRHSLGPAARLAGELLAVRRAHLLGDAGALVLMAHPQLFEVRRQRMALVDGRLVLDARADGGREVDVVVAADAAAVVAAYVASLSGTRSPDRPT